MDAIKIMTEWPFENTIDYYWFNLLYLNNQVNINLKLNNK